MPRKNKVVVPEEDEVAAESAELYRVIDPEDADRVLEVGDKKIEFKRGDVEKVIVDKEVADALKAKYPYLVVEEI